MNRIVQLSMIFSLILLGNVGCAIPGDQTLPADLENRISSSHETADDHLAAALLYQQQARLAQTEADRYKQAAASIKPIEDPKGFRRDALLMAAQERQSTANEMRQLYAAHEAKAHTMMGKHQQQ